MLGGVVVGSMGGGSKNRYKSGGILGKADLSAYEMVVRMRVGGWFERWEFGCWAGKKFGGVVIACGNV